jgi:hypothetical protein
LEIPQAERRACAKAALGYPNLGEKDRMTLESALAKLAAAPGPNGKPAGLMSRLLRR